MSKNVYIRLYDSKNNLSSNLKSINLTNFPSNDGIYGFQRNLHKISWKLFQLGYDLSERTGHYVYIAHTHTHTYIYIYIYMYIYMYMCMCVCIYIYIYTYIHFINFYKMNMTSSGFFRMIMTKLNFICDAPEIHCMNIIYIQTSNSRKLEYQQSHLS